MMNLKTDPKGFPQFLLGFSNPITGVVSKKISFTIPAEESPFFSITGSSLFFGGDG
jgi:hypothetical protein